MSRLVSNTIPPVIIGGAGGSGTRLIAALLEHAGFHMGYCHNSARDNLWFTLLFRHLSMQVSQEQFTRHYAILKKAMFGQKLSKREIEYVKNIPSPLNIEKKFQHALPSLLAAGNRDVGVIDIWGWKEPNTHIFLPKLFYEEPELRYILVVRNGLDMAFSRNQNQARLWGPVLLNKPYHPTPTYHLSYWVAMHRRVFRIKNRMQGQLYCLNYDQLCNRPDENIAALFSFLSLDFSLEQSTDIVSSIDAKPSSIGRFRNHDLTELEKSDVEFVDAMGFDVT